VLLTLNLLAFMFHTVLGWVGQQYQLVGQTLAARQPFFQDLQALTRYLLCESWDHLLDCMLVIFCARVSEPIGPGNRCPCRVVAPCWQMA